MALVRDKKDDTVEMTITLFRQGLGQEKLYLPHLHPLQESIFVYTLWFNFILGYFIFFCVWVW